MIEKAEKEAEEEIKKFKEEVHSLTLEEAEKIKKSAEEEREKLKRKVEEKTKEKAINFVLLKAKSLWKKIGK